MEDERVSGGVQASAERFRDPQGKENQILQEPSRDVGQLAPSPELESCFKCRKSLANSRHLISVAGRAHNWHSECFSCELCHSPLDRESSCHIYEDKILCRKDYVKLRSHSSTKCSRCRWPIEASDWVRRAADFVYHLVCFSCDVCLRQLNTGEQFTLNENRLLCRLHFAIDQSRRSRGHAPPAETRTPVGRYPEIAGALLDSAAANLAPLDFGCPALGEGELLGEDADRAQAGVSAHQEQLQRLHQISAAAQPSGRPKMRASPAGHLQQLGQFAAEDELSAHQSSSSSSSGSQSLGGLALGPGASSKSKRVRTTFTEDQLSILQTHFQIDSNPDGQDLERIATITGLSKRVTQVWFQNSRARQKKYLIKRKPVGGNPLALGHNQTQQQQQFRAEATPSAAAASTFRRLSRADERGRRKWPAVGSRSQSPDEEVASDADANDEREELTSSSGGSSPVARLAAFEDTRDEQ